jgi:excinuclease UvrABC nuclease subunit
MRDHGSLDDILCDPELAGQFDEIAQRLAPGFTSLQYRWGALTLRKTSKTARVRSEFFRELSLDEFETSQQLRAWKTLEDISDISDSSGLYLITGRLRQKIYVGGTLNLRNRLSTQFAPSQRDEWDRRGAVSISLLRKPDVTDPIDLLSMQKRLIQDCSPILNDLGPTAA